VRKYYCRSDEAGAAIVHKEPLFDEPWTGTTWHEIDVHLFVHVLKGYLLNFIQDALPDPNTTQCPSCYLPLHIWLDKGQVSTKVKKHPIVLRGLWIDSIVCNSSGNGGGALLGYVIMVCDPSPYVINIDSDFSRLAFETLIQKISILARGKTTPS
jgi:hypothetical protein